MQINTAIMLTMIITVVLLPDPFSSSLTTKSVRILDVLTDNKNIFYMNIYPMYTSFEETFTNYKKELSDQIPLELKITFIITKFIGKSPVMQVF